MSDKHRPECECDACIAEAETQANLDTLKYEDERDQEVNELRQQVRKLEAQLAQVQGEVEKWKRLAGVKCADCGLPYAIAQDAQGEWSRCLGCEVKSLTTQLRRLTEALSFYHNLEECAKGQVAGNPCFDPVAHAALTEGT